MFKVGLSNYFEVMFVSGGSPRRVCKDLVLFWAVNPRLIAIAERPYALVNQPSAMIRQMARASSDNNFEPAETAVNSVGEMGGLTETAFGRP